MLSSQFTARTWQAKDERRFEGAKVDDRATLAKDKE